MSEIQNILKDLKDDLENKIKQREGILDQLSLVDIELDRLNSIISPMDSDAGELSNQINKKVDKIKDAYDARIDADCRTNLIWKQIDSWTTTNFITDTEETFQTWEVQYNGGPPPNGVGNGSGTYGHTPFHGIKYYQKPTERDYGSNLVTSFTGFVNYDSLAVGMSTSNFRSNETPTPPSDIQIGDTITDSLVQPEVFSIGDLPEIVSIGTTSVVGIVTTIVGGISTGSNVFYHFGAGDSGMSTSGMVLLEPVATGQTSGYGSVLSDQGYSLITGFGQDNYEIEYYNEVGVLSTTTIVVPTITLSRNAIDALEEGRFRVGFITETVGFYLSTTAKGVKEDSEFFVIRSDEDVDAGFNYLSNPNSPVTIGTIKTSSGGVGSGSSVYYDSSGDPDGTRSWRPETARDKIEIDDGDDIPEIKEPYVGSGRAEYWIGTTQWPTLTAGTQVGGGATVYTTSYAELGTKVTIGGTSNSASIGYANIGPTTPGNCSSFDSAISLAESEASSIINKNKPQIQSLISGTEPLREKRSEKQLYAWSLLQASSRVKEEIEKLESLISKMESTNYSKYDK